MLSNKIPSLTFVDKNRNEYPRKILKMSSMFQIINQVFNY